MSRQARQFVFDCMPKGCKYGNAMSGIQMGNFMTLVNTFDFSRYNSLADIGGADGTLSIQICLHHADIQCKTYDLPPVEPLAKKRIATFNLGNRIEVLSGNFLKDDYRLLK